MASQTSSQNGSNVEVIDLTDEAAIHEKTITIDDSVIVASDDENANDAWNSYVPKKPDLPIVIEHSETSGSSTSSSLPSMLPTSSASPEVPTGKHPSAASSMPSPISSSPSRSPFHISHSPMPSPISSTPPRSPPPPSSLSPMPSPMSTPSPKTTKPSFKPPSLKRGKAPTPKLDKKTREENKKIKLKQKEEEKLVKEANRANAANKALENCTANIDQNILKIVGDPEEETFKTLFDESMVEYRLTEYPRVDNSITWTYKRAEVVDNTCVNKYRDASWIIVVMEGSEYLKRLIAYKDGADSSESIKTYLSDVRRRSASDVVLLVYNLSNHMKSERAKEAKNYRKTFKDRFEGQTSKGADDQTHNDRSNVAAIGPTQLQELRLMLEIEFKRSHTKWKMHIEFYERKIEIVQIIVRYTLSIARLEIKQKAKASTGLDWAINMDKERAVDPTKSTEDLTKLWITQLQQFSHITLPIAKAIAAEYHSPCALLDQYKSLTTTEAEDLLAELYVQRNLKRKIGSNISKRIHCFMTSEDPNVHIGLS